MMIDEGREAPTGEGKDLTIELVSFPFYTRCHHHHHGDGDVGDGVDAGHGDLDDNDGEDDFDEVRGEKNAHTAGHVYFTVPDIRTIDLIIRTKGKYTEDNDDNEMMT